MLLDWVRGVERLHCLPAQAGVPQHRWGVFLNDFDQDTVVLGGHVQSGTRRVGQKIRGNHSLR
jgi:hypothetical protein